MAIYALGDQEPTIDAAAYIHPDAVIIGSVTIGPDSSVWPHAVLRGDDGEIVIGARSSIQDGSVLHCTHVHPTVVGDDCTVGHLAHLEGCRIADGALVGSGSVVLHDAVVESGALVAANAVVLGGTVVPARAMAVGIPAKIKLDAVHPAQTELPAASYVERAQRFARDLRRLD